MGIAEQQLAALRAEIDALDETLAQTLLTRCGIVRQVAALKAQHWPADCHIRPGREGKMHQAIARRFAGTDIPPIVALAIWRQLIGASTHLESPLSIAFSADFPEHFWLAREYFGAQAALYRAPTNDDALAAICNGSCTILLLPPTADAGMLEAVNKAGFMLFAALPVMAQMLPAEQPPAFAFARITPEPSGDDVSYFLQGGKLLTRDGFHTTHEDALFIGAHPRPIPMLNSIRGGMNNPKEPL